MKARTLHQSMLCQSKAVIESVCTLSQVLKFDDKRAFSLVFISPSILYSLSFSLSFLAEIDTWKFFRMTDDKKICIKTKVANSERVSLQLNVHPVPLNTAIYITCIFTERKIPIYLSSRLPARPHTHAGHKHLLAASLWPPLLLFSSHTERKFTTRTKPSAKFPISLVMRT